MPVSGRNQLQDLIDSPSESLEVEYKSWLDLQSSEVKADLARHIAAMANHGGGTIIFGFDDSMQPVSGKSMNLDRDIVSGIVKHYLEPPFQCDVVTIRSRAGMDHSAIVVPPHKAVPICAKAGGPMVNGKPKGIIQAAYYIRKTGPASEQITTANEWNPLIRRCAMHERTAIVGAIDAALRGGHAAEGNDDALQKWHEAAHKAFMDIATKDDREPRLDKNHFQLSYSIVTSDGKQIEPSRLNLILHEIDGEIHDTVKSGWTVFHPFNIDPIGPYFNTDPASGLGDRDFLECALLKKPMFREIGFDFWRISPDGKATVIREYWEDSPEFVAPLGAQRGTIYSPNVLSQTLAELVRHARGLAERFDTATDVVFRCEWWGLEGRVIGDPSAGWFPNQYQSKTAHRITTGSWPVGALASNLPEIVSALGSSVTRAFGIISGPVFTAEWIAGQRQRWLH
ncbi:MAG TPA: ATP-binding protein [Stellaceae bacterium]|nr:ATP-binding protein [Stellaceae bacterium]